MEITFNFEIATFVIGVATLACAFFKKAMLLRISHHGVNF